MSKKQKAAKPVKKSPLKKSAASGRNNKRKSTVKATASKSSAKKPSKPLKKAATKSARPLKKAVAKPVINRKSNTKGKKQVKSASKPLKKKSPVKKPVKAAKSLAGKKTTKPSAVKKTVGKAAGKSSATKQKSKNIPVKSSNSNKKLPSVPVASKQAKQEKMQQKQPAKTAAAVKNTPEKNNTERKRTLNDLFSKKGSDHKATDVLAINNTIPVKKKEDISPSKIASISYSITNPVRKTDSYAVKPDKEPQGKFELEFVVHASAEMLYEFLSTPSGLSEWFCDDLNIRNGIYTFIWDDQLQQARLLKTIDQQLVRFQWVDKSDGSYFEFRIQRDDLTNDISLIITDFADTHPERESSKLLWNSQIEKLMHVIGSIF